MSKKHKRVFESSASSESGVMHSGEYKVIKHDLIRVLVLNLIYLAAVLVLYYTNLRSHYLEAWFSRILHF